MGCHLPKQLVWPVETDIVTHFSPSPSSPFVRLLGALYRTSLRTGIMLVAQPRAAQDPSRVMAYSKYMISWKLCSHSFCCHGLKIENTHIVTSCRFDLASFRTLSQSPEENSTPSVFHPLVILQLYHVHTGTGRSSRDHERRACCARTFGVAHGPYKGNEAFISYRGRKRRKGLEGPGGGAGCCG